MDFPVTRIKGGVGAPRGFQCSALSCGIKNPAAERLDLALIYSESPCTSAGTFTINLSIAMLPPPRLCRLAERFENVLPVEAAILPIGPLARASDDVTYLVTRVGVVAGDRDLVGFVGDRTTSPPSE